MSKSNILDTARKADVITPVEVIGGSGGETAGDAGQFHVSFQLSERFLLWTRLYIRRFSEYLLFDAKVFQQFCAALGFSLGLLLFLGGQRGKALRVLAALHRVNWSTFSDRLSEALFRREVARLRTPPMATASPLAAHILAIGPLPATQKFFDSPERLLGTRLLVLKSARKNEKGIILIDYSFAFPLVAKLFDLDQIANRYHIVLEPSWSGYCDFDILCYSKLDSPVFVEAYEPRDSRLITTFRSNLIPVSTSANWWVDYRIMRPLPAIRKDCDVVMVASWARFKRHARFFAALAKLRRRGRRLRATLIGYPSDCRMADIMQEAAYFGVLDQLEFFEWLQPDEVNYQLNRSKVNIIWSRREGVNRVIIEGMFANVPCILREGFNYGYRYPYVNAATGRFATEATLPEVMLELLECYGQYTPRDWVMEHINCQKGTEIIGSAVRDVALGLGEAWTGSPVVRVCHLNAMRYWDEDDKARFANDYGYLRSLVKSARV